MKIYLALNFIATLTLASANSALAADRDITFSGNCQHAESSAILSFNGDILPHHHLYEYILPKKSFSPLWIKTRGLIEKADFSVGNLEGPAALGINASGRDRGDVGWIYDAHYYKDGQKKDPAYDNQVVYSGTNFVFNFHPRILSDLKNTGYDLITLANNHALDRYSIGINRTLEAARKIGLPTSGVRMTNENRETDFYHIDIVNDIMVAFISCTEETNGRLEDEIVKGSKKRYHQVLRCMRNEDEISNMIKAIAPSVDAVVVLPHWGIEYQENESANQRRFAHKWIQDGALAVVGSHPHVLQPWEKYVAKNIDGNIIREGVIMYSLGNFVASQKGDERKTGIVTYMGLSKDSYGTKISAVGYTPTYRNSYEAEPITNMSPQIKKIVLPKFGGANFVKPKESLGPKFCR